MSNSAEDALQEAGAALRQAVEILRRRPVDDLAAKALVDEFHELRTVMATAALLMKSFDLPRFAGLLHQSAALDEADADLNTCLEHLNSAAASLTTARQRLDLRL